MGEPIETMQQLLRRSMKGKESEIVQRRVGQRGPTVPYKLLTLLLYGKVPGVRRLGSGHILVQTTELATYMRVSNDRLRTYAEKLMDWGCLEDVELNQGTMFITLAKPMGWDDE
jgi:hypothetical protein